MKYSLYLGRIAGIKISIHWTFLILILWIVFANMRSGLGAYEIVWSVLFVLTIFVCVIMHELGHALAARRYNIKTRVINVLPIGGVAQLESIPEKPKEELFIALAGPAVNIAIAFVLFPLTRMPSDPEELATLQTIGPQNFLFALMTINLWLALFNLIPAFPMDGGRVLRALLGFKLTHAHATRIAASIGQLLAIGFVFLGFAYNPFLIFIGLFIFLGAQSEAVYSQHKLLLKGYTVRDVAMHELPVIENGARVRDAVAVLLNGQNRNFIVMQDGRPVGTISRDTIIKALGERGEEGAITDVKDSELVTVHPDLPLEQAWNMMHQHKKPLMLIMQHNELIGVVDQENMAEFVLVRTAEEKANRST